MITPSQIPNPYVKPRWQAPVGIMEQIVAYNCRKHGMPRPVLAMPMWEGAGNRAIDLSGYGNHGTNNGAEWVADGLDFVAANEDYVNIGTQSFLGDEASDEPITIVTTAKLDTLVANPFVSAGAIDAVNGLFFGISGGNDLAFLLYDSSTNDRIGKNSQTAQTAGEQAQYVATYTGNSLGSGIKLYKNGIELSTNSLDAGAYVASSGSSGWVFGARWIGGAHESYHDGTISYIYIYNTALTAAQVKFLYDNPYFMYQMPEELYGYTTGAPPAVSIPVFMHHYNQLRGA